MPCLLPYDGADDDGVSEPPPSTDPPDGYIAADADERDAEDDEVEEEGDADDGDAEDDDLYFTVSTDPVDPSDSKIHRLRLSASLL